MLLQAGNLEGIPFRVTGKLRCPEIGVCFRQSAARAVVMMPKAAVNKYDGATARKCKIGLAGKVRSMQSEPVSHLVRQSSNNLFRASVTILHGSHVRAALTCRESIAHDSNFLRNQSYTARWSS